MSDWLRERFITHADCPPDEMFLLHSDFIYWDDADPPDRVIDGLARYGMKPWNGPDRWRGLFDYFMPPTDPADVEAILRDYERPMWGTA